MLALCEVIGRRTRDAATRGRSTFAIPEAAESAAWVADRVPDPMLRTEAAAWRASGANYHELVRLCARAVSALDSADPPFERRYREKVEGELEPMLALWPGVIAMPTAAELTPLMMIRLRAYPVHPLGLVAGRAWTDGKP